MEAVQQPDGSLELRYVLLVQSKGLVSVLQKGVVAGSAALRLPPETDAPVALVLNGKGVLHRQLSAGSGERATGVELFRAAMPAADPGDFYVQEYHGASTTFLSLSRRSLVDRLLESGFGQGVRVVALHFGCVVLTHLWPYIREEVAGHTLSLEEWQVSFSEEQITGFRQAPGPDGAAQASLKIGDEEIEGKYVLAYAAALELVAALPEQAQLAVPKVAEARAEHRFKKLFQVGFAAVLTFFFLVLLGNFWLYAEMTRENDALQGLIGNRNKDLAQLTSLQRDVSDKKAFLKEAGWLASPQLSFYADRLAASMPEGLGLTELSINPYNTRASKDKRKAVFQMGTISVKGSCSNPLALNAWIRDLGKQEWIIRVADQSYSFDEGRKRGNFSFQIQIAEGK